jgi:hypothetical protein
VLKVPAAGLLGTKVGLKPVAGQMLQAAELVAARSWVFSQRSVVRAARMEFQASGLSA